MEAQAFLSTDHLENHAREWTRTFGHRGGSTKHSQALVKSCQNSPSGTHVICIAIPFRVFERWYPGMLRLPSQKPNSMKNTIVFDIVSTKHYSSILVFAKKQRAQVRVLIVLHESHISFALTLTKPQEGKFCNLFHSLSKAALAAGIVNAFFIIPNPLPFRFFPKCIRIGFLTDLDTRTGVLCCNAAHGRRIK